MLLVLLMVAAQASAGVRISGTVRDATGLPLAGAIVEVDSVLVAVSDDNGEFQISLTSGSRSLIRVALPGFEPYVSAIEPRAGTRLDVTLALGRMQDRVRVVAPVATPVAEQTLDLEPLRAYRTPGAQADLFRTLQTLPGVSAPDEAAGLFVRGGDVSEVLVALDDVLIAHPYRYETPTGGFRGAVDPLLVTGLTFSAGGFSARHGNALSAIVDLHGLEQPQAPELTGTVGLAGASASVAWPAGSRFGLRGTANSTFTSLLFAVNGSPRRFEPPPEGWDGSAGFIWNLGSAGRVKMFALRQSDEVGVETEQDAFVGFLRSSSTHDFVGGRWDVPIGRWSASASIGADSYTRGTTVGVLDIGMTDRVESWRVDLTPPPVGRHRWRLGTNGTVNNTLMSGVKPVRGGDLGGAGGTARFDVSLRDWFGGTYVESTTTAARLAITIGARVDRFARARSTTVDPRLNVRIGLGGSRALRIASGLYHQAPAPAYYDRVLGASDVVPMQAIHYVAGYETGRETEGAYFRAEAYAKKYSRLPLQDTDRGYVSNGYGSAHGLDLFGQWLSSRLELRASASWLRARRRWTPVDQRERYELSDGTWPADFEIPWSLQMIANVPLTRAVNAGVSWRSASGRPHTPIVGSLPTSGGLLPVFGALNSDRLPRYERLDLSVSRLVPAGGGVVVLFASVDNVLGRPNFFQYAYTSDYSSRRPVTGASPRSVFVGMTFRR